MSGYSPIPSSVGPPSTQVTLAIPSNLVSPTHRRPSSILVGECLQATSPPLGASIRSGSSSGSVASILLRPSIPSIDKCCLDLLEPDTLCRACEHQWLLYKFWPQNTELGRGRWLTAPSVRLAESMGTDILGVPREDDLTGHIGSGFGSSAADTIDKYRVVNPSPVISERNCDGTGSTGLSFLPSDPNPWLQVNGSG